MTYSSKQQNQKLFHLTKLYKERIRKDFLWRSVEYSGSWYEWPQVLKLALFLAGGSRWFKACVGAHNLQNRSWSDLFIVLLQSYDTDAHTHNHLVAFVQDNPGRPVPEETPIHTHPDHRTSFIIFLHLQWSMASCLFISCAWHTTLKIAKTCRHRIKALILLTSSTDKNPPHAGGHTAPYSSLSSAWHVWDNINVMNGVIKSSSHVAKHCGDLCLFIVKP